MALSFASNPDLGASIPYLSFFTLDPNINWQQRIKLDGQISWYFTACYASGGAVLAGYKMQIYKNGTAWGGLNVVSTEYGGTNLSRILRYTFYRSSGWVGGDQIRFRLYGYDTAGNLSSDYLDSYNLWVNMEPVLNYGISNPTKNPKSCYVYWPAATDSMGISHAFGDELQGTLSYEVAINTKSNIIKNAANRALTTPGFTLDLSQYTTPGGSVTVYVRAYDGWDMSNYISKALVYNNKPTAPQNLRYTDSGVGDNVTIAWDASTDADGDALTYDVMFELSDDGVSWYDTGEPILFQGISATSYSFNLSQCTQPNQYVRFSVRANDQTEFSDFSNTTPARQRLMLAAITNFLPQANVVESTINMTWTYDNDANQVTRFNLQYAEGADANSIGGWNSIYYLPENMPSYLSKQFSWNIANKTRGSVIKFKLTAYSEALGRWSQPVESPIIYRNKLPNDIYGLTPSSAVLFKPFSTNSSGISFNIDARNGDPDNGSQLLWKLEIAINKTNSETQSWKLLQDWTAITDPNLTASYSAVLTKTLLRSEAFYGSAFDLNAIYGYCQVRAQVKDNAGGVNPNYKYSAAFTLDLREPPNAVTVSSLKVDGVTLEANTLVNAGKSIVIGWDRPTDINDETSFIYNVYRIVNSGSYQKIGTLSSSDPTIAFTYIVPVLDFNINLEFEITATDSTSLTSSNNVRSVQIEACRRVSPLIEIQEAARNDQDETQLDVIIYSADTGGSRSSTTVTFEDILAYWPDHKNLSSIEYGYQYSRYADFPVADTVKVTDSTYGNSNIPPFICDYVASVPQEGVGISMPQATIETSRSYYVRAFITIDGATVVSNSIFVRESYPTMAVRKNRVGINNKNPETRSAALTVTAISTTHQTVLDIEANGDETEAYIGFRADPMNAGDLTGRIGMEIDGNAYVETNGVKKQLVTPDLIPDSIQIGAIMMWPSRFLPSNQYLICDGTAYSRTDYPVLFQRLCPFIGDASIYIASPGTITVDNHGLLNDDPIYFASDGLLPTGMSVGVVYYVVNKTANTFAISLTPGGAAINLSGTQSGNHKVYACPWGVGDGINTFNVPCYCGETPIGVDERNMGTCTMTIASPAVVTLNNHGLVSGDKIYFVTTGALPTGIVANVTYYVKYLTDNTFNIAATAGGASINTSGTQSGTHSMYNAMFNRVGKQYGEKAHKLLDEEMPVHTHIQNAHGHTQTDHTHTSAAHYHTINHDHGNAGTGGVTANHRHSTAYYPLSSPRAYGANESNTGYNVGGGFAWATSGWIDTDHAHYLDMPNFTGNSGTTTPAATGGAQAVLQDKIATNQNAGGDQPHSNMQRSRATYYIIKAQ